MSLVRIQSPATRLEMTYRMNIKMSLFRFDRITYTHIHHNTLFPSKKLLLMSLPPSRPQCQGSPCSGSDCAAAAALAGVGAESTAPAQLLTAGACRAGCPSKIASIPWAMGGA